MVFIKVVEFGNFLEVVVVVIGVSFVCLVAEISLEGAVGSYGFLGMVFLKFEGDFLIVDLVVVMFVK